MNRSDQGITRTGRGEEEPKDKDRAQEAHRSGSSKPSPSQEETPKEGRENPSRSGRE
jgi:hypothetical protein